MLELVRGTRKEDKLRHVLRMFEAGLNDKTKNATVQEKYSGIMDTKPVTGAEDVAQYEPLESGTPLSEWSVDYAIDDAFSHGDTGRDNLVMVGAIPAFIEELSGISGDFYLRINHAYENMTTKEQAIADGRYHGRNHHGIDREVFKNILLNLDSAYAATSNIGKYGNPELTLYFDDNGPNGLPIYASIGFYRNEDINGDYSKKPHLTITMAERSNDDTGENRSRWGNIRLLKDAANTGTLLILEKEKRADLSVKAQNSSLGVVTESALSKNVARFREIVNRFKEENGIRYSLPFTDSSGNELIDSQREYFKNSKVVDDNGKLKVMYHGTENEFTVFEPVKYGGKNGVQFGFGIYLADTADVSKNYGNKVIEAYANVTNPAYADRKAMRPTKLSKLIEATCREEAKKMVSDGEYDSLTDALRDTWISNYVDTYSWSFKSAVVECANSIINQNDSDFDIVLEVMSGIGIRDYEDAYEFYKTLEKTTGINGFIIKQKKESDGINPTVVVAFYSNQVKRTDNKNPTNDQDIRYSIGVGDNITKSNRELVKENQRPSEQVELLKQEMRLSGGHTMNRPGCYAEKGEPEQH